MHYFLIHKMHRNGNMLDALRDLARTQDVDTRLTILGNRDGLISGWHIQEALMLIEAISPLDASIRDTDLRIVGTDG